MTALIHRLTAWLDALLGYREPQPVRLGCGCLDAGARYLCLHCDRATCEQHRLAPHHCKLKES
ncbi:hypothetical protein Drose_06345 [Dactylosporangium roseum]|uniref:AN1-type domain-containing protein n=1 Tax=Dactylosporangium roseum TaxID=47989 RepID=A0ABY5Z7R3_9ACTN|nr:hypothetical protein [Dactylosporangium roseum]UWZ37892.1 hypothetical protein Drose_06345 [Dactylosporangium roseum]